MNPLWKKMHLQVHMEEQLNTFMLRRDTLDAIVLTRLSPLFLANDQVQLSSLSLCCCCSIHLTALSQFIRAYDLSHSRKLQITAYERDGERERERERERRTSHECMNRLPLGANLTGEKEEEVKLWRD